jgi:hypothetical protein
LNVLPAKAARDTQLGADGGAASWRKTTPTSGPGGVTLGCTDADFAFAVEAIELLAAP